MMTRCWDGPQEVRRGKCDAPARRVGRLRRVNRAGSARDLVAGFQAPNPATYIVGSHPGWDFSESRWDQRVFVRAGPWAAPRASSGCLRPQRCAPVLSERAQIERYAPSYRASFTPKKPGTDPGEQPAHRAWVRWLPWVPSMQPSLTTVTMLRKMPPSNRRASQKQPRCKRGDDLAGELRHPWTTVGRWLLLGGATRTLMALCHDTATGAS